MGLVIDTSALVALERASRPWDAALSSLGDEPAALPAIVCAELLVGVRLARSAARAASGAPRFMRSLGESPWSIWAYPSRSVGPTCSAA